MTARMSEWPPMRSDGILAQTSAPPTPNSARLALPREDRELINNNSLAGNLGNSSSVEYQSVLAPLPKTKFDPLYHSVYFGRQRLGHYVRISPKRYAAYDARNRLLAKFASKRKAFSAVGAAAPRGNR
jgi:hypothetical protein